MLKVTQFKYKTPLFLLLTLLSCFLIFRISFWWVNGVNEYPYPYNINPGSIHLTPDYCKPLVAFIYVDDTAEGYTLTFTQNSITEDSSQVVQTWYQGQGWTVYSGKYGNGLSKSLGQFNVLGKRVRAWGDLNVYPSSVFPQKTHISQSQIIEFCPQ